MKTYRAVVLIKAKDESEAEDKFYEMEREELNDSVLFEEAK